MDFFVRFINSNFKSNFMAKNIMKWFQRNSNAPDDDDDVDDV